MIFQGGGGGGPDPCPPSGSAHGDQDEMPHQADFHLGLHCRTNYLFMGIQILKD